MPLDKPSCAGCGASENLSAIYGQIYRGPKPEGGPKIKALPKVNICDTCMKAVCKRRIDTRTAKIADALSMSIKHGYNAITGENL